MIVSVFADASYCDKYKVGTYGAWAKSDRGAARHSGILKGPINNSGHAELAGVGNAVWLAFKTGVATFGDRIIVQCDCLSVVRIINGKQSPSRANEKAVEAAIAELIKSKNAAVEARHVKGHQGCKDKRSAVNEWCDSSAYFLLDKARSRKRSQMRRERRNKQ